LIAVVPEQAPQLAALEWRASPEQQALPVREQAPVQPGLQELAAWAQREELAAHQECRASDERRDHPGRD